MENSNLDKIYSQMMQEQNLTRGGQTGSSGTSLTRGGQTGSSGTSLTRGGQTGSSVTPTPTGTLSVTPTQTGTAPVTPTPTPSSGVAGTSGTSNRNRRNDGIHYEPCPETLPIKRYCKNETIRKIQKCIGVTPDSKFGPITQEALENLDLPGTRITADSLAKACAHTLNTNTTNNQQPESNQNNQQPTDNTTNKLKSSDYYDDYTTFETENGDELSQNQVSTYDDYSAIEGDDETTSTSQSDDSPVTSSTPPTSGEPIDIELTPKQKARNAYMYGQPNN